MTQYLTTRAVGAARPNAEDAWLKRVNYQIPWSRVWKSFGTPLSDASEEKQWRKLMHRAIFTRNRDPDAQDKNCRLGCGCGESMLHLAQCPYTSALWTRLLTVLASITDKIPIAREIKPLERGTLFGVQDNTLRLLPPLYLYLHRHSPEPARRLHEPPC